MNIEGYTIKYDYGACWILIFYHLSENQYLFTNEAEFNDSQTSYKYSIIGKAPYFHRVSNKYEFLLEYPGIDGYNRWTQTVFPTSYTEDQNSSVPGFDCVNCTWNNFMGLARPDHKNSFLEGQPHNQGWFFAIGQKSKWADENRNYGIPGPLIPVQSVLLWMRINLSQTLSRCDLNHFKQCINCYILVLFIRKY